MSERPIVYFTKKITDDNLVKIFDLIGKELQEPVAVKVHSGEDGNTNFLRPQFFKKLVDKVNGTICECNTAYGGARNYTHLHKKLLDKHDWTTVYPGKVDLMDENEEEDYELPVEGSYKIKTNIVGGHFKKYKSMLVVSHLKGHAMGGFGGALKQLSIGCASTAGKCWIHSAGVTKDQTELWTKIAQQDDFLDSMSDAASSVIKHFNGQMAFINVMKNISISCDCEATPQPPCMQDIGILGSDDPVAVDQACIDMIMNSPDPGREKVLARINQLHGIRTIERTAERGVGRRDYILKEVQ